MWHSVQLFSIRTPINFCVCVVFLCVFFSMDTHENNSENIKSEANELTFETSQKLKHFENVERSGELTHMIGVTL